MFRGLRVTKETNKVTRKWTVQHQEGLRVVEKEVESFKNEHEMLLFLRFCRYLETYFFVPKPFMWNICHSDAQIRELDQWM